MEGTLMEASYTAPFHFINQRELSEQSSNAIIGVEYPPGVDTEIGITHLQLMNIPYLLGLREPGRRGAGDTRGGGRLAGGAAGRRSAVFSFYHIKDCSDYVQIMQNEPVRVNIGAGTEWRDMAVEWYKSASALDTALIRDTGDEALQQFTELMPESADVSARSAYRDRRPGQQHRVREPEASRSTPLPSGYRTGSRSRTSPTGT